MHDKNTLFSNKLAIILSLYAIVMAFWWLVISSRNLVDTSQNYIFGLFLGFLPLIGGVGGLWRSKEWDGLKSAIGRALFFLSLGLLSWAIGTLIFAYYNLFLDVAVPYPSIADLAYIMSWPLWAIGIVNLSKATGMQFQLKKTSGKIGFLMIPLFTIVASYYLLFDIARGGEIDWSTGILKFFFDLAYPVGDIVILTLALLIFGLSFRYLGGKFRFPIIIILIGFVLNYFADFSFSYTTTIETFYVASWVDFLFTVTMFVLSLGVNLMTSRD